MTTPTTRSPTPIPTYFNVPATAVPETLFSELERCGGGKEAAAINTLYPKLGQLTPEEQQRMAVLGEIIIAQEYIVIGGMDEVKNEGKDYSFLIPGRSFLLKNPGNGTPPIRVKVEKNRRCGPAARALILLKADRSLQDLADEKDNLQVITDDADANLVGEIHPGRVNGAGSGQGYPNAYGQSRPVLPSEFLPLFASLDPVPVPVPHPPATPGKKHHTLLEWLLLTFYQFIAWLLSALGFGAKKPVNGPAKPMLSVKVAILDTGLNGEPAPESGTCEFVHTGWNFVANTPNVHDDHVSQHGTRIAAIIRQQAPSAVVLPVKTANELGVCELYDVLCGMEYARVNGARVVNASFSFSSNADPDSHAIPLMEKMISVLEKANIWVIAAAGNAIQYAHDADGDTPPLGQGAPFLYPACYSRASNRTDTDDRMITVTTVSKTQQAGTTPVFGLGECYSPAFVDVGMIANSQPPAALFTDDRSFKAPGFLTDEPGTSYATAYMSGRVANALATQAFAGKTQLMTAIGPELKPSLAVGIHEGQSIPT